MSSRYQMLAARLGIAVHDHIIIGKKGHSSMKGLLLI
ncbi:JAB domain-containing protein [Mesorhizobium sp.]|nr:JAB domain-containing protein [Mesorhizobium sp.]